MQLEKNPSSSHVACLKSFDGFTTLRFIVHDYQFPEITTGSDFDWYRITIEYECRALRVSYETTKFNARNFQDFARALSQLRGERLERRMLLYPSDGSTFEVGLISRTPKLRTLRSRKGKTHLSKFPRTQSGLFIEGNLHCLQFNFKVTTVELKSCHDEVSQITKAFPIRNKPPSYAINPVQTLEAKFKGEKVSAEVTKWMTSWIESEISHLAKPLFRTIKRNARRKHLAPQDLKAMLEAAKQRCRNKVIESYRQQ